MSATTLTRRGFLATAGAVGAAATLRPRLAFASPENPSTGDVIVLVFLRGGADGLSLVAPFQMGTYHDLRPTIAVKPTGAAGVAGLPLVAGGAVAPFALDGTFALHPAMSALHAGPWANGDLAVIHAAGMPRSESDSRSHFESMKNWEAGSASLAVNTGFLNRFLQNVGATTRLSAMAAGSNAPRSLAGPVAAYAMQSPADFGVSGFSEVNLARSVLSSWYGSGDPTDLVRAVGRSTIAAVDQLRTIDWNGPTYAVRNGAAYPNTTFGQDLREVAQLIRANVGLRVACVDFGSWDTHQGMGAPGSAGWFDRLAGELSRSLTAFYTDLGNDMGEVTLATISEFGRTINENGTGGTDHGRGSVMFVMGRNVTGGVHGAFVDRIADGPEGDLAVLNDYRTVLAEVLTERGGAASMSTIFPTWTPAAGLGVCTP